jgi:hypothetical protein
LLRAEDRLKLETFTSFESIKDLFNKPKPEEAKDYHPYLACFVKNSQHWLYHRTQTEDYEEEKQNPADKLWLIVKSLINDKDYDYHLSGGFKLEVGDTVKFGRVRYKIIMYHNEKVGLRQYDLMNRSQILPASKQ